MFLFAPSQIDPKVAFPRRTQPKVRQLKLFSLLLFHLSTLTRLHSDPFSADCSAALHWLEAPFDSVSALSVTGGFMTAFEMWVLFFLLLCNVIPAEIFS